MSLDQLYLESLVVITVGTDQGRELIDGGLKLFGVVNPSLSLLSQLQLTLLLGQLHLSPESGDQVLQGILGLILLLQLGNGVLQLILELAILLAGLVEHQADGIELGLQGQRSKLESLHHLIYYL